MSRLLFLTLMAFFVLASTGLSAADFTQFRGESGKAVVAESNVPSTWSDDSNLLWKSELSGRGSSSPIVVGGKVFVTAYAGYGNPEQPGSQEQLVRELLCFDLANGKQLWKATVRNQQREDQYQGFITEHGYATSTPVSDGESVFVFFWQVRRVGL